MAAIRFKSSETLITPTSENEIQLPNNDDGSQANHQSQSSESYITNIQFISKHLLEFQLIKTHQVQLLTPIVLDSYNPHDKVVIFDLDGTLINENIVGLPLLRPMAISLLSFLYEKYELWLWSASEMAHIESVFALFPIKQYFHRVLDIKMCTTVRDNMVVKDLLRIRNINLKRVIAIDNNITSYANNINNLLYIDTYCKEGDNELSYLFSLIDYVFMKDDARDVLERVCMLNKYLKYFN